VVLRLGKIVKDAPTHLFDGDTLVAMITGTITELPSEKKSQ
jgi:hypothetical protein